MATFLPPSSPLSPFDQDPRDRDRKDRDRPRRIRRRPIPPITEILPPFLTRRMRRAFFPALPPGPPPGGYPYPPEPGYTYPPNQTQATRTAPVQHPATTRARPVPELEAHAVTTSMEPPAYWAEKIWPPVDDLPELTDAFTTRDQLPPQQPDPLQTSYDVHNVQYNDYNQPEEGDQYA